MNTEIGVMQLNVELLLLTLYTRTVSIFVARTGLNFIWNVGGVQCCYCLFIYRISPAIRRGFPLSLSLSL